MMEREIKFRGKTREGKWVYGYYLPLHSLRDTAGKDAYGQIFEERKEKDKYLPKGWIIVIANTIGQYTGLKDKNGVEIYEGDIVEVNVTRNEKAHYRVTWRNCLFVFEDGVPCSTVYNVAMYVENHKEIEVIGNIYDNPELIGE